MRFYPAILISMFFLVSCDDGDISITTFEFEEEPLSMCSDERNKVLYHINNQEVFETLSIAINSSRFSREEGLLLSAPASFGVPLSGNTIAPVDITLSGNNEIIYRTYDDEVPSDYFCRDIPPSAPIVQQEYRSVGGELRITTSVAYSTSNNLPDHDRDGIPSSEEGMSSNQDTDGDGIPDYLDIDDDGDNVPTTTELNVQVDDEDPTEDSLPDTDGDGIPNYLDPDDDGDGVPTRLEVTAADQGPAQNFNEDNVPRYLDRFSTARFDGNPEDILPNVIQVRYVSTVEAQNLKLKNRGGDGEEISFVTKNLGTLASGEVETLIVPEGEENPDEETDEENPEG